MDPAQGDNDSVNDSGFSDELETLGDVDRGDADNMESEERLLNYQDTNCNSIINNPEDSFSTLSSELPVSPPLPAPIIEDFVQPSRPEFTYLINDGYYTPNLTSVSSPSSQQHDVISLTVFPLKNVLQSICIGTLIAIIVHTSIAVWPMLEPGICWNDFWNILTCNLAEFQQNLCGKVSLSPDQFRRIVTETPSTKSLYKELSHSNSIFGKFLRSLRRA